MKLADKCIVVTGAAGGIGAALARRFATEQPRGIVVSDRDEAGILAVASEIDALAVPCDVTKESQVRELVDAAEARFGPIDLFCSNAGVISLGGAEASDEDWQLSLGVNVMAHVYAARILVPAMVERGGGYLLQTASAAGLLTQLGSAPYSVTKHAALALAEWLAITYGDRGLRVSCLCPMGVNTPLVQRGLEMDGPEGLGAKIVAASGELLDPADVAKDVMAALKEERFFILPHPVVGEFYRRKGDDHDRWLAGMRRLQARVEQAVQQG